MKPRLRVSVSGGRTSAYMAWWVKQNLSHLYEIVYVFANTSWEHPDTYRFVNAVDNAFNLGLVWVEAVPQRESGRSCGHRVVTYETAAKNGEVFESVVASYGLPNRTFQLCNREMKLNAMASYARSIGWKNRSYETAIGIRIDEPRRINRETAKREKLLYPLVDMEPTDKQDVLTFFEQFDWDLRIEEFEGNCRGCFKKSDAKLFAAYKKAPEVFDLPIKLHTLYENVGPNNVPGPRRMYRQYRSAQDLIASFSAAADETALSVTDGGCSESCEPYQMELAQ